MGFMFIKKIIRFILNLYDFIDKWVQIQFPTKYRNNEI